MVQSQLCGGLEQSNSSFKKRMILFLISGTSMNEQFDSLYT
jgi:hypothetical protein